MNIDSIQNGIVIDHITAGYSMKLYELLGLDKLDCSVAVIRNVVSKKMGKKDIIKIDDLATKYPLIVAEWHPIKNAELRITDYVVGSARKVWWKCAKCGYEWQTEIRHRTLRGTGCPKCADQKVGKTRVANAIKRDGCFSDEQLLLDLYCYGTDAVLLSNIDTHTQSGIRSKGLAANGTLSIPQAFCSTAKATIITASITRLNTSCLFSPKRKSFTPFKKY